MGVLYLRKPLPRWPSQARAAEVRVKAHSPGLANNEMTGVGVTEAVLSHPDGGLSQLCELRGGRPPCLS